MTGEAVKIASIEFKVNPCVFYLVLADENYVAKADLMDMLVDLHDVGIQATGLFVSGGPVISAIQFDCAGTSKEAQDAFFARIEALKGK